MTEIHTLSDISRIESEVIALKEYAKILFIGSRIFNTKNEPKTESARVEAIDDQWFDFQERMMDLSATILRVVARSLRLNETEAREHLGKFKAWHALINSGISDPKAVPFDDLPSHGPVKPIKQILKLACDGRLPVLAA